MAVKLKSCPFCGGKAYVKKMVFNNRVIKCPQCGVIVGLAGVGNADLDDRLREAWDSRSNNAVED